MKNKLLINKQIISIQTLECLQKFAIKLADQLSIPTAILLFGEMGCGKTQFTQFIISALSLLHKSKLNENINVTSPTFTLHNSYHIDNFTVEHFDLFRLKNEIDIESIGLWEIAQQKSAILIIEWAERLKGVSLIPSHLKKEWNIINIHFFYKEDKDGQICRYLQVHYE